MIIKFADMLVSTPNDAFDKIKNNLYHASYPTTEKNIDMNIIRKINFLLIPFYVFSNQQVFLSEFNLSLDIFFYSFENEIVSNSILIIISFFIGVIICLISIGITVVQKSMKITELQKKIASIESKSQIEGK